MRQQWFDPEKPPGETRLRLFCFPYAGGSASAFRGWQGSLCDGVEVLAARLPGRADRWREPPLTELTTFVEVFAQQLADYLDKPFAFFGHSMGALVSFDLSRKLRRDHGREPEHLFVASCNPPLPDKPMPVLASLNDEDLRAKLLSLGLDEEVLADDDLMEILLPLVRADLHVADGYVDQSGEQLDCPVTAFHGRDDPMVSAEEMAMWSRGTRGPFALHTVSGAHLFDDQGWSEVLARLSEGLSADAVQTVLIREG